MIKYNRKINFTHSLKGLALFKDLLGQRLGQFMRQDLVFFKLRCEFANN